VNDKESVDAAGHVYHVDAGGTITKGGQIDPYGSVTLQNVTGMFSKQGELEALTAEGHSKVRFEDQDTYCYDQCLQLPNDKLKRISTSLMLRGQKYTLAHERIEKEIRLRLRSK